MKKIFVISSALFVISFFFYISKRYIEYRNVLVIQKKIYNNAVCSYDYSFIEDYQKVHRDYPPVIKDFIKPPKLSLEEKKNYNMVFENYPWVNRFYDPYSKNDSLSYGPLTSNGILFNDYIIYSIGPDRLDNNKENIHNYNGGYNGDTLFFKGFRADKYPNFFNFDTGYDILLKLPSNKNIVIVYK